MLNIESEEIFDPNWWSKTMKEIEEAKKSFIDSGKIGGNPLGFPDDALKIDILKNGAVK